MERILVATDMTREGDIALRRAAALASGLDAELVLLHVMQGGLPDDLHAMFESSLMARLEGKAEDLRERFGIEVTARIGIGTDWMVILDRIEEEGTDLLVMGMHRHPGLIDLFRGTTVERVAKACGVPLLLVRGEGDAPYRSVLLTTDYSLAAREALTAADHLAPKARFRALHAFTIPFGRYLRGTSRNEVLEAERRRARAEAEAGMATFLGGCEDRVRAGDRVIVEQAPTAAIREEIAETPTDLLALGMHSRPRLSEALLGSVARGLMADPPCDILAVPPSTGVEHAFMGENR